MSEEGKVDLRVQKTERALLEAMHTLIQDKPFHEISVSDLCDTAMIRRATFYKHFKDKYDFLDFCIEKKRSNLDAACERQGADGPMDYCTAVMREALGHMRDNRLLLERAAHRSDMSLMPDVYRQRFLESFIQRIYQRIDQDKPLPVPPEVMASFVTGAMMGVMRWWMHADSGLSEERLVEYVRTILAACLPLTGCNEGACKETKNKEETGDER